MLTPSRYVYRIRNGAGLYSTGGLTPKFTKSGKVWNSIGSLKNHFNLHKEYNGYHQRYGVNKDFPYGYKEKIYIVKFQILESEVGFAEIDTEQNILTKTKGF